MIEQIPVVAAAPEPITMAGVQMMIQMMLNRQMEETRHLLQHNRDEPTVPIVQPKLDEELSEEGSYNHTMHDPS